MFLKETRIFAPFRYSDKSLLFFLGTFSVVLVLQLKLSALVSTPNAELVSTAPNNLLTICRLKAGSSYNISRFNGFFLRFLDFFFRWWIFYRLFLVSKLLWCWSRTLLFLRLSRSLTQKLSSTHLLKKITVFVFFPLVQILAFLLLTSFIRILNFLPLSHCFRNH